VQVTPGYRSTTAASICSPGDPATPPELADAVKKFANLLMDIGAGAMAEQHQPAKGAKDADATNATITELGVTPIGSACESLEAAINTLIDFGIPRAALAVCLAATRQRG
jgi:hypothetical protein